MVRYNAIQSYELMNVNKTESTALDPLSNNTVVYTKANNFGSNIPHIICCSVAWSGSSEGN